VWAGPSKTSADAPESVVAIGDVHGDFDDFVAILQRTGLIDKQNHWTGGKATFVQVGDLLDRGPKPREVMDLMMSLEKEAAQAGGRVVGLLGNHEVMNVMGDLRYVTVENYASFADNNSEKRQKSAYQEYLKWRKDHPQLLAELPQPMELTEPEWMARHPAGFIEHREAFSPNGSYGKWLREHSPLAKIGGVVFLHGGIHPNLAHLKLDTINAHIRDEIKAFDTAKQYMQDQKLILPFFTLQEVAAVVPRMRNAKPGSYNSWGSETGSACVSMVHSGFEVMTSGAKKRAPHSWASSWTLTRRHTSWWGTPFRRAGASGPVLETKCF